MEEKCDNGDQDYQCINDEESRQHEDQRGTVYSRDVVMKSPDWFEKIVPLYCPANLVAKVEKFIRKLK